MLYQLVSSESVEGLTKKVNALLETDFRATVHGSPFTTGRIEHSGSLHSPVSSVKVVFHQAVILPS